MKDRPVLLPGEIFKSEVPVGKRQSRHLLLSKKQEQLVCGNE